MTEHEKCECHQCVWLRTDPLSRALIPHPSQFQPSREKLSCTCKTIHFDPCHCECHKKPDRIEEKIRELSHAFHSWIDKSGERDIRKELRELVELARKETC